MQPSVCSMQEKFCSVQMLTRPPLTGGPTPPHQSARRQTPPGQAMTSPRPLRPAPPHAPTRRRPPRKNAFAKTPPAQTRTHRRKHGKDCTEAVPSTCSWEAAGAPHCDATTAESFQEEVLPAATQTRTVKKPRIRRPRGAYIVRNEKAFVTGRASRIMTKPQLLATFHQIYVCHPMSQNLPWIRRMVSASDHWHSH